MVFCRLENGLSGVIHINDLTDSASHLSPESLVTSGNTTVSPQLSSSDGYLTALVYIQANT